DRLPRGLGQDLRRGIDQVAACQHDREYQDREQEDDLPSVVAQVEIGDRPAGSAGVRRSRRGYWGRRPCHGVRLPETAGAAATGIAAAEAHRSASASAGTTRAAA